LCYELNIPAIKNKKIKKSTTKNIPFLGTGYILTRMYPERPFLQETVQNSKKNNKKSTVEDQTRCNM